MELSTQRIEYLPLIFNKFLRLITTPDKIDSRREIGNIHNLMVCCTADRLNNTSCDISDKDDIIVDSGNGKVWLAGLG